MTNIKDITQKLDLIGREVENLPQGSEQQRAAIVSYLNFYEGPYATILHASGDLALSGGYISQTPRAHMYTLYLRMFAIPEAGEILPHPNNR